MRTYTSAVVSSLSSPFSAQRAARRRSLRRDGEPLSTRSISSRSRSFWLSVLIASSWSMVASTAPWFARSTASMTSSSMSGNIVLKSVMAWVNSSCIVDAMPAPGGRARETSRVRARRRLSWYVGLDLRSTGRQRGRASIGHPSERRSLRRAPGSVLALSVNYRRAATPAAGVLRRAKPWCAIFTFCVSGAQCACVSAEPRGGEVVDINRERVIVRRRGAQPAGVPRPPVGAHVCYIVCKLPSSLWPSDVATNVLNTTTPRQLAATFQSSDLKITYWVIRLILSIVLCITEMR